MTCSQTRRTKTLAMFQNSKHREEPNALAFTAGIKASTPLTDVWRAKPTSDQREPLLAELRGEERRAIIPKGQNQLSHGPISKLIKLDKI